MEQRLASISQAQAKQTSELRQELEAVASALLRRIEAADSKVAGLQDQIQRADHALDQRMSALEGQTRQALEQLRHRVDGALSGLESREVKLRRSVDEHLAQSELVYRQRLDRWVETVDRRLAAKAPATPDSHQSPPTPRQAPVQPSRPAVAPENVDWPQETPAARGHSFADLATPLTATVRELEEGARMPALPPPRRVSRAETALLLIGGVSALALGATGFAAWERGQDRPERPAAMVSADGASAKVAAASGEVPDQDLRSATLQTDARALRAESFVRVPHRSNPPEAADEDPAWTALRSAAGGGDPAAMHDLGLHYLGGRSPNARLAAKWFRAAADKGFAASQFNLARLYETGSGVPRDLAQAARLYRQAAAHGDATARERAEALEAQIATSPLPPSREARSAPEGARLTPSAILDAQRTLSRLGYYVGPIDGKDSDTLQDAIAKYARDAGMAPQVLPGG